MSTTYPLPDGIKVKTLLGMLFDGIEVKNGAKLDFSAKSSSYVGVFVADDGKPVALCGCDLAFASNSSAALSMLPPAAAKDAAKTKTLTDVMLANLREVMNICTRLLITDTSPHLKLGELCPASALPAPAAAVVAAAKGRADFEISLAKYGSGVLSVVTV